ncbi:MAG: AmmeMemoRadiSam system protein A [Melioribacteraceae bacterium]|nr:AmmeMemoRadiSam system protein A [Melioribacteraceae bacterium]
MTFSIEEKKLLLSIARESIESQLLGTKFHFTDFSSIPNFSLKAGAFVTLTIKNQLRGCIGFIVSDQELYKTVHEVAIEAAFEDPRFPSLSSDELKDVRLEISVLSPPFPMKSYDEIELGVHGLILNEKGKRGLLLPQVPIEHEMNKEEYLDAICQKAGLPKNSWRNKQLNIDLFTAEVFSENELFS